MEAMGINDMENTSMEIQSEENINVEHSSTKSQSTCKIAKYDVFISHRGPDTKTGFVGYLYEALKARGLMTFLDCRSIEVGEGAWRSIENAIKSSKIAIVVFSEGFASSSWCLKELDAILDTRGMEVHVIFYKVRPSEVRHPESGILKNAFEKLRERHEISVIDHWKRRLEEASQLMGWELPCDSRRLESDFSSDIVNKILARANKPLPFGEGDCAVGVEEVAMELVQILENEKEVLMLGLWGMGGIGKSTLARVLYNQMSPKYDSSCFIEDVSEVVHHGGIKAVQQQILKDLCKIDPNDIDGKSKGKTILKERLSKIRFLLVLDDIQDSGVMEHCVLHEMFTKGSMCIVTSRDKSILKIPPSLKRGCVAREVYIHDVQGLNMANAREVLKFYAFGGCWRMNSHDEELVSRICGGCGGVPLVIKVIGAFLREKEVKIWNEMVEKLSVGAIMDEKMLFECLRISYDALSREYQEIFLDIACALIGEEKDYAVRIWKCGNDGIQKLVEMALISVDESGLLKMHDHLRDMGREIERGSIERRRMWMPEALTILQRRKCLPPTLQALNLTFGRGDKDIDRDFKLYLNVSHLTDLRILVCNEWVKIVSNLPRSTCWFSLTSRKQFARVDFPTIHKDNELTIVVCRSARVYGLLNSMRELSKLKILDLGSSGLQLQFWERWNLSRSFRKLSSLEELNLGWCPKLTLLPDSFGSLKKLHILLLNDLGITRLPNSFGELSNLEVLDLMHCDKLTVLPDSFGSLKKLHKLLLNDLGITRLLNSFGELSNLEVLDLKHCDKLTVLPNSFGNLKKLHMLKLRYSGIMRLPNTFGELSNLEVLDLGFCHKLMMLPDSFGSLKKLHTLLLYDSGITGLPITFGDLSSLEELNLVRCQNLTVLPDSFGSLKKLHKLQLWDSGITRLPRTFGELSNLEVLDLGFCRKLMMLLYSFGSLKKLHTLQLHNSGITGLPITFGELSSLEELNLVRCQKLTMLPDSFGSLKKLHKLLLNDLGITRLPNSFGELSNLEVLDLMHCDKLTVLPNSFGNLKKLHMLKLRYSGIMRLPNTFGELSNLEVLDLGFCHKLMMLPDSFGSLKKLHTLQLHNSGITGLPITFGELSSLEELNLVRCQKLTVLPDSFGSLKKLHTLHLEASGIAQG